MLSKDHGILSRVAEFTSSRGFSMFVQNFCGIRYRQVERAQMLRILVGLRRP